MLEVERQTERNERHALRLHPIKLHTMQVEGHLGGHVWSKPFGSYLDHSVSTRKRDWWEHPYLTEVIERALGPDAFAALWAWQCEGESYEVVVSRTCAHKPAQLGMWAAQARKIAATLWK